jgi:NTE family protein
MAQTKKALVLSGGGGRGAYHIGVLEALVESGWMQDGQGPDIIAGTSIGAINAAALASGLKVAELKRRWLAMHTEEVHRLSTDLPAAARPLLRFMLRSVLTSDAHGGARDSLPAEERGMSAPDSLMPLDWIIDYEETNHQTLFAMGKADAARALTQR